MKNDVVRWSGQPNSDSKNNNNNNSSSCSSSSSRSKNNSKYRQEISNINNVQSMQHVASKRSCQSTATMANVAATSSNWQQQQQQQQQQTINECDITNLNYNCNLFNISFLTTTTTTNKENNRKTKCIRRRHSIEPRATQTPTSTSLRLLLQFSLVVFLCKLNVGFAAKMEPGHAQSPLLSPYVLDYENAAVSSGAGSGADSGSGSDSGAGSARNVREVGGNGGHYTHTWAVHIPNGDNGIADAVAKEHGFVNLGKIFDDHYHFAHHKVSKRSLTPASHHQTRLDLDERVHWAKQQRAKSRSKRDFIRMRPSRTSSRAMSLVDAVSFDDPKWPQMWYLNRGNGLDMNVIPAWKEGITGKGVVVTILDDGLESNHPDIEQNYDPKASYDVNSHDDDPMPHYDMTDSNRHGTRCAGEVAATANNSFCAVGIAYGASVGGVRMLDGDVTDAVEARSLSLNPQHIDIYSASWGPDDDGKTVDGPGELASRAFIEGTTKGRGGKGSIFIWASGNGGREMDNCNCDGYTNSIWTLSISSATEEGNVPWYSEKCSSTLATTYSSGGQSEKQVVTTDLHHSCTASHTGTSASAPLAAGIAALVLQSNQNLTWRDLQHIVVRTAKPANLKDSSWSINGVGRRVSHSFGYGLMDASDMVRVARTWKTVPEQHRCEINAPHVDKAIPPRKHITLQLAVNHCLSVNYLEHVQAKITLTSQRRGDIQLYLRSPANTRVTLLTSRIHDNSRSGFNQWPFMSVHTWGESPHGNWQLEIHNEGRYMGHALLREWSLIFYGTTLTIDPKDPISTPRGVSDEQATTPNSSGGQGSTSSNLHQVYSPQYPLISPNNFAQMPAGGAKLPLGKMPPNKSNLVTNNPLPPVPPPKQGYQQISATYGVLLGKTNSNSNNNNNSKGNNKGNNKGSKGNKSGNGKANNRKEQAMQSGNSNSSINSSKPGNTKKSPSAPPPPSHSMLPAGGSSFLPDQRILKKQQLLMAAAGVLAPQDDSADNANANVDSEQAAGDDDSEETILQLAPSSYRKGTSTNAQITQWDMILYGTEVPPQPDDEPNKSQRNQFNLYGNDMAHNDIEHDASGQWRNMQQVGEVDMAQDRSNAAACLKWSDQKCLECQEPSYFYQDLCYDECPRHTFAQNKVDEIDLDVALSDSDITAANAVPDVDNELHSSDQSFSDLDDPLQAAERRRRSSDSSSTVLLTPRHSRICASCDKSCLRCYGPSASQCSTCYPGSQLRKLVETNETYCYAYVVRSTVTDVTNPANPQLETDARVQYMTWTTALLVIAVIVSLVGVGVAGGMLYQRREDKSELYTRVALIADDEADDSGEDQEDELFNARHHHPSDVLEYHDELQSSQLPSESLKDGEIEEEMEEHAQLVPK
ncbi:furin-like protease 1 isoform X3 [Drosophila navojoa]|uniref:furin-like protease 1 isoform X3 n=1 Tax=Drosophila navojoa TaxID=7232 RepID=UPI0008475ABB|nr:furin-like protease 1 isoform X3 [Drosophila navojoa]